MKIISLLFYFEIFLINLTGQEIIYLSPTQNSRNNPRQSSIIISFSEQIDLKNFDYESIKVNGSKSGEISGVIKLLNGNKTITFTPNTLFQYEENVSVYLDDLKLLNNDKNIRFSFSFEIESEKCKKFVDEFKLTSNELSIKKINELNSKQSLPKIKTKIYNESLLGEGKIFLSSYGVINQNFQSDPKISSSILIANNDGSIFFHKDIGSNQGAGLTDFKMHPNGLISYPKVIKNYQWTGGAEVIHYVMDKSFTVVDSFQMGNGYIAETHDFKLLTNGHALLMGYYLTPINLSDKIKGAPPEQYIDGAVIQELDENKNVIFQWRVWDYINPQNIPWQLVPNNTQQILNVFHLNSINLDFDGNILLGTVGMGMKINRQTGEIIWIIGGAFNQFTFTNVNPQEAIGDFGGHTFQRIENGNILVFDNSPFPWQQGYGIISSEVVEYKLDEKDKTAELVWKYKPEKLIPGWHAGSAQRLSNGNTFICWGGPPTIGTEEIPLVTEVTPNGEKVFELFYEGSELESYRAFRFILNDGKPNIKVTKDLILEQNTYDFKSGNDDIGVSLKVNSLESFGYNMITADNYNFAPENPRFEGLAPLVFPRKLILNGYGISKIDAEIRFDISNWKIQDPNKTIIYFRKDNGKFIALNTIYNFVTKKITATINDFGEFILATPDLEQKIFTPIPNSPKDKSNVNYKLPVELKWSPVGFANYYDLQVSQDENFSNVLIHEKNIQSALYVLSNLSNNTQYFWRVRAINSSGVSNWCKTQTFRTVSPYIKIIKPNGGERWNIGLDYYINWEKNVVEPVKILLLKNDSVYQLLTTSNSNFYLWSIDLKIKLDLEYKIKVISSVDSTIYDLSDNNFSIIDSITAIEKENILSDKFCLYQNYPNPFNGITSFSFIINEENYTTLKIYNSLGEEVSSVIDKVLPKGRYSIKWNSNDLPSGIYYYRLTSGKNMTTKKFILMK